jgi:peptidoglycan/xylan/chitin deacetylase (PgdA/CDA1 family)
MDNFFNLYTNSAEYHNDFPDMFGRSRFYNAENNNILSPVISKEIYSSGFRPVYPDGKKFAVCISHDIDHLFLNQTTRRKFLNGTKSILKGQLSSGMAFYKSMIKEKISKDYDLRNLLAINERHHIKSTYYFLSLQEGEEDFNYQLGDVSDQAGAVLKAGSEIGLHGGHKAFNDPVKLSQEKKMLEDNIGIKVQGYRNHFLKFKIPVTWYNLEQAGFLYDSTLGYPDNVGFRNGMCYPYYPYDIMKNQFLNFIELPLTIMDATLFYYMRLDSDVAFKICKKIIDQIIEYQGVLTLLWHNNFLAGEMGSVYLKLLDYLKDKDPWYATSGELVKHWQQENMMKRSKEIVSDLIKT